VARCVSTASCHRAGAHPHFRDDETGQDVLTRLWHAKEVLLAGERVEQRVQARCDVPAPSELRQVEVLVPRALWRHLQHRHMYRFQGWNDLILAQGDMPRFRPERCTWRRRHCLARVCTAHPHDFRPANVTTAQLQLAAAAGGPQVLHCRLQLVCPQGAGTQEAAGRDCWQ
jgi:hypothetical protein